jgi:peroxiredoxin
MRSARRFGLLLGLLCAIPAWAQTLDLGRPAPGITLTDVAGGTHRLSEYRGSVVLLNFWATWCVPCRTEMPSVEQAYRRFKGKGLVVLAVNLDAGSRSPVEAFAKELGLTFPVLLDPQWTSSHAYRVLGLPTSYLIDREGRLVGREIGPRDWSRGDALKKLETLLK